jgi:pyruvate/2-oxoglutarate dehydrogenase complex dihydrolipoamide acyltransferase (E2) component
MLLTTAMTLLREQLGFMSAFLKASANALKEIPAVNGYIDDRTKEIVHRNYVDISVAVASPQGKRTARIYFCRWYVLVSKHMCIRIKHVHDSVA